MGIPVYFKTIISEYEETILLKDKLNNCHSLFLDLNCAIHPCCQNESDESIMIQKIITKIESLINYTNLTDLLFIAIDGVPPKGKMKQQRMRRYKSVLENKKWDTNAISPGTFFMKKLNNSINTWINNSNYDFKIIFSDSNERGEGEHKILHYLKNNTINENSVIYGLDADLIQLSLVSKKDNIYLLRERTEYNIENTQNEYIYLMIDKLKLYIEKEVKNIDDYIFICFFLGNDFINHIDSINLRYNGYDLLINTYKKLQERYGGYFQLIDFKQEYCIHLTFLKEFISELSLEENNSLKNIDNIRNKQYKRIYSKYHDLFELFQSKIKNKDKIDLNYIYDFQKYFQYNSEDCSEMIYNLPILFYKTEKDTVKTNTQDLCDDYLNSLIWTTNYYFKECIHWKYCTKYEETPSLVYFSKYLSNIQNLNFTKDKKEYEINELLNYIFPNDSHKLHNYKIKSKDYNLFIKPHFKRYLWECDIIFE